MASAAELENSIDAGIQDLSCGFSMISIDLVNAANTLDDEIDALEIQFEFDKEKARELIDEKKNELLSQIETFKRKLNEKRKITQEKAAEFEDELSSGMVQNKDAFLKLFS